MVRSRAAEAGFKVKLGYQVFLATGTTAYLRPVLIEEPERRRSVMASGASRHLADNGITADDVRQKRAEISERAGSFLRRSKPGALPNLASRSSASIYCRRCQMSRDRKTVAAEAAKQTSPQEPKLNVQAASRAVPPN